MVLGQDDPKRAKGASEPRRGGPSKLGRVPPPDVELPQREAGERPRPREAPDDGGDRDVGDGSEKSVEQHGRIG